MSKDIFTKQWIIDNSIIICNQYDDGILTLRSLHYQLVSIGMTNDINHYKRVVTAMIDARWNGDISFEKFSDLDRTMVGETKSKITYVNEEVERAKNAIIGWMNFYSKNRWENQDYYPEVLIEKKALQGVFEKVTNKYDIALGACKGYPSLTFLNDIAHRFDSAMEDGKMPIILYFGDYDPSGEDIPRSIKENLSRFGQDIELKRIALMEDQVVEWNLPPAPAKETDVRTAKWSGLGQVELDAIKPEKLQNMCENAILEIFDENKYDHLLKIESEERIKYKRWLGEYVQDINSEN